MLKIVDIEQHTPEWHAWRKGKIGASMIAGIMGISPFSNQTPLKIFNQMIEGSETTPNEHMIRGTELEPIARDRFNQKYNTNYQPACIESVEFPYMICSLDGYSPYEEIKIIEIKCPSVQKSMIPDHYFAQMQFQMFILGEDKAIYVSYSQGDLIDMVVHRDDLFIEKMLIAVKAFKRSLDAFEPPEPIKGDLVEIYDPEAHLKAQELKSIRATIKSLEKEECRIKKELIAIANGSQSLIGDVKILYQKNKDKIDYESIPVLKDMDLTPWKKPGAQFWKIV
jgi:putative phage-type endonuclease